jgi:hypothetical protein
MGRGLAWSWRLRLENVLARRGVELEDGAGDGEEIAN